MKVKSKTAPLAKDQLWKVNGEYLHIVDLGKTLIHYKMSAGLKQRGVPVKMTAIDTCKVLEDQSSCFGEGVKSFVRHAR